MIELSGQAAKCLEKIRKRGSIEAILIQILNYWQILLCYCKSQVSMMTVFLFQKRVCFGCSKQQEVV